MLQRFLKGFYLRNNKACKAQIKDLAT